MSLTDTLMAVVIGSVRGGDIRQTFVSDCFVVCPVLFFFGCLANGPFYVVSPCDCRAGTQSAVPEAGYIKAGRQEPTCCSRDPNYPVEYGQCTAS